MDDATLLSMHYGNLSPLLCSLGGCSLSEVSRLCTKKGLSCPPQLPPVSPVCPCLSVHVSVHLCADLIVRFFITFSFPSVYGPWDWK